MCDSHECVSAAAPSFRSCCLGFAAAPPHCVCLSEFDSHRVILQNCECIQWVEPGQTANLATGAARMHCWRLRRQRVQRDRDLVLFRYMPDPSLAPHDMAARREPPGRLARRGWLAAAAAALLVLVLVTKGWFIVFATSPSPGRPAARHLLVVPRPKPPGALRQLCNAAPPAYAAV